MRALQASCIYIISQSSVWALGVRMEPSTGASRKARPAGKKRYVSDLSQVLVKRCCLGLSLRALTMARPVFHDARWAVMDVGVMGGRNAPKPSSLHACPATTDAHLSVSMVLMRRVFVWFCALMVLQHRAAKYFPTSICMTWRS